MNLTAIISFLDNYLEKSGRKYLEAPEANALLVKSGLLRDSKTRPGQPLRVLLRDKMLPHAYQPGGAGSTWIIPHSKSGRTPESSYQRELKPLKAQTNAEHPVNSGSNIDLGTLKKQLEKARTKYKPEQVKFLLIAEAPPDVIERFFYYEDVRKHDYLFMGVAQMLYPALKDEFLNSGRNSAKKKAILERLKAEGFYLLDLSDLPLGLLTEGLESQLPVLLKKIRETVNHDTKIILIKVNVYDTVFPFFMREGVENVIDERITFPGSGGQAKFQVEFKRALEMAGYLI